MAGIGKNSAAATDKQDSIDELKKQFDASHDKIAKIKNNRSEAVRRVRAAAHRKSAAVRLVGIELHTQDDVRRRKGSGKR